MTEYCMKFTKAQPGRSRAFKVTESPYATVY